MSGNGSVARVSRQTPLLAQELASMARLLLQFDSTVLREFPVSTHPITIGRAPDNDIHIDNLAVSNYHARVYSENYRLVVEDLDSLNGTFLNNRRVKKEWLRSGDAILIGKHLLILDQEHDVAPALDSGRRAVAPKVDETVLFQAKRGPQGAQPAGAADAGSQSDRARAPSLIVLKGKTDQKDYLLSDRLTIIGKSPMATVRLRGWFAPQVAAQVNKRQDGYYIGLTQRVVKVNGNPISGLTRLNDGDLIEVGGVCLKFTYSD
jgi:predicted component of type VI protein secretion system